MITRLMLPHEQGQVVALAKQFKGTREFGYLWTHYGNWEAHPPVVVLVKEQLAGFHAYSFGKRNLYVNSYYLAVDPRFRGMGVAGATVAFMLAAAQDAGMKRLKMKCFQNSPGRTFWEGFGLKSFGHDEKNQYYYDVDLGQETDPIQWMDWNNQRDLHQPLPPKELEKYKARGVRLFRRKVRGV